MGVFDGASADRDTESARSSPAATAPSALTQSESTPFTLRAVVTDCADSGWILSAERGQSRAR